MRHTASAMLRDRDLLTRLDSAIGDGDHGANMARGFGAVQAGLARSGLVPSTVVAPPDGSDAPGEVLVRAGNCLVSVVGGASGPLFGGAFRALGEALGSSPEVDAHRFATGLAAGLAKIQQLGAAVPGDKTMIDAYAPAVDAFRAAAESGTAFATAAQAAAEAAEAGMRDTVPLQARKGRAAYLGLRSIGHQDPGATSTAAVFRALAEASGHLR
ncbi:dihydroxyacetone kinase subunit DhaL [Streptomyces sp. NPDC059649]|uniref:dihydroxyacetone kinase subunit DhaL n=1 Tax=Streptomyces sp. NPDC059649 TaxID=3346895 RepID=UPI0036CBE152